jgi:murein DD-endopeptidase MepM/ murein hydrolase activator NlpD
MPKRICLIFLLCAIFISARPVQAQDITPTPPTGPIYIVVSGDTLGNIATRFNVPLTDLLAANNISDPNNISVGTQLIIPGLEGITGFLLTETVAYGDTLKSISRRQQTSEDLLHKLNHITSPAELYAGVSLVVAQKEIETTAPPTRFSLSAGETLLEQAVKQQTDIWTLQRLNALKGSWSAVPTEVLYSPTLVQDQQASGLPSAILSATVNPLPLKQGGTAIIRASAAPGVNLSGILVDKKLNFFSEGNDNYVALQGLHALLEPGIYPLRLEATLPDGSRQSFEQMVVVQTGYYPDDPILLVEPSTIDPSVTEPENKQIFSLTSIATPQKYWNGLFQNPSAFTDCFTSRYGNRRTYIGDGTGEQYFSFHTGLDFCGGVGLPIIAPAAGKVIFAGPLTVRGNATIIDHGWGIYSGFWHQSEINVQLNQIVQAGEQIGVVGGTGRVTGAHLHWEVWVNGVQVDPLDWLANVYP